MANREVDGSQCTAVCGYVDNNKILNKDLKAVDWIIAELEKN